MGQILNKESSTSLPEQIAEIIRSRIRTALYMPKKKIDSIRRLSADLETSPVTIIKALDLLEEEGTVVRLPGKGVFVSEKFNSKKRLLTACFAFPETHFSEVRDSEQRALNNEFYQGLMHGAMEENIKLQFSYFSSTPTREQLEQQLKETENYDFMIFSSFQHSALMKKTALKMPVFCCRGSATTQFPEGVYVSDYDRPDAREKLFQLFLDSNCRSAAALTTVNSGQNPSDRTQDFLRRVAEAGKITPHDGVWLLPFLDWNFDYDEALTRLKKYLKREQPEFIFCSSTGLLSLIYEAAFSLKIQIGKDLMVTGIASGITTENLFPRYTYLKIPRYEQGVDIMHAASRYIRQKIAIDLPVHKVQLVAGQSVNLKNH